MKHKTLIKNIILLLLATATLVLGAVLPGVVAAWQDEGHGVSFAPISAVELELRQDGLTLGERIAILSDPSTTTEIPEGMAERTSEEILDLAAEQLMAYQKAGLILSPDLDVHTQTFSCVPWMAIYYGDVTRNCVYWALRIQFDGEEMPLYLTIDDETGIILAIQYEDSKTGYYLDGETDYFDPEISMDTLREVYLAELGEEFTEHEPSYVETEALGAPYGQYCQLSWGETLYGECRIAFDMWHYGFRISLVS